VKLSQEYAYPAGVEQVYELITDPSFREEDCAAQGSADYAVTVVPEGDGHAVTIRRTMPADDMPDLVRKLTGDTVKVEQTENWGPPGPDGARTADVKVEIIGQPAQMKGTATLTGSGDTAAFRVNAEVKVSIPLLGKKIEPIVANAIIKALDTDVELGTARL